MSVSEVCLQMGCQLSESPLPVIWIIETLARSTQVDVSILLELLEKSPEIPENLCKNAQELVFLRILESFPGHGHEAQPVSVTAASSPKIAFHPSEFCEDVLQQIVLETPESNLVPAGSEMCKWDVQTFTSHKRSRLSATHALQQLKNAILRGSHSIPLSLKEQSGLLAPEHGLEAEDDICNGVTPRSEITERNTHQINESNDKLISHALANNSNLLQSEKLLPRKKRKKSAATENTAGNSSKKYILSRNGSKFLINNSSKKYILSRNGSKIRIKIINKHKDEVIAQHNEKQKRSLDKDANVGGIRLNEPPGDEIIKECISLKEVPCFDTELLNEKSEDAHGQEENEIEKAKCDLNPAKDMDKCDLNSAEDMDKSELLIHLNVPIVNSQCRDNQDWGDLNMLADICSKIIQSNEVQDCTLEKRINHEFTSSEGNFGLDKALHLKTEALHRDTKMPDENFPNLVESEENDDIAKEKNAILEKYYSKVVKKNECVKCNKSGKLLICSDKSCLVAIHKVCLGSDGSFSTGEKDFYCPFCEYQRTVTMYMEVKKNRSLARNDLVAFFYRETRKESKKHYTSCHIREEQNGIERHGEKRFEKQDLRSLDANLPHEYKSPPHTEPAVDREISKEKTEDSGASKYFISVQKHEKENSFSSLPQLRRKRQTWTTAEEEKLKEGILRFYSPDDRVIPWKKIQEFGADVFHESRSSVDLKDKWRNLCKASS